MTDPDGAITRVAPWSTWTREQRRAPGGEPALLTRLDDGQLWFSAGSSGSPWRHEVHVGPAVVSTPRGRFHAIAELDGGATIACLAGHTRVAPALREPVLLDADQTVAVSSDGETLVVITRGPEPGPVIPGPPMARSNRRRRSRLPEASVVVALVAVLAGLVLLFGPDLLASDQVAAPVAFSTQIPTDGIEAPEPDVLEPKTPAIPEPESPAVVAAVTSPPGTADGRLTSCRRSESGVVAVIDVRHRSGGPGRFTVDVALVDGVGTVFATGSARSRVIEPSTSSWVEVAVDADPAARGACELTGITGN